MLGRPGMERIVFIIRGTTLHLDWGIREKKKNRQIENITSIRKWPAAKSITVQMIGHPVSPFSLPFKTPGFSPHRNIPHLETGSDEKNGRLDSVVSVNL